MCVGGGGERGGLDRIIYDSLRNSINDVPEYLHKLFNILFIKVHFPSVWSLD